MIIHLNFNLYFYSTSADDHMASDFRDPELDTDRCPDPEWLICSAVCTHLGCTPNRGGAYNGWLCPCHGSHYDTSGVTIIFYDDI